MKSRNFDIHPLLIWVLSGALLGVLASFVIFFIIPLVGDSGNPNEWSVSVVTVVSPPTTVPATSTIEATATMAASDVTPTPLSDQVSNFEVGDLVEVYGTGGEGLRLREYAGLSAEVNFLGLENEIFEVMDGPIEAGEYSWWFLRNPYDLNRQGWTVGVFLRAFED